MKLDIDDFDDSTGWVETGSVTVAENEVPGYIAGNGTAKSLLFHFPTGSAGESISKDLTGSPIDVTLYDKLIFSVWSRNRGKTRYVNYTDTEYILRLSGAFERHVRVWKNFAQEEIDISGLSSITEITFEAKHSVDDYLLVSLMVGEVQQSPYDTLVGVQEALEYYLGVAHPTGLLLTTTVTGLAGHISVDLFDAYLDRYAVLQFGDTGSGTEEIHMLKEREGPDGQTYTFNDLYDGEELQFDHTGDTVHLLFPVGIGGHESEVTLPGISIWSMTPEPVDRGNDLDETRYNFTPTTTGVQTEGKIMSYPVLIDCEARQYVILELLTQAVRAMMSVDHTLWINGRKHDIEWSEVPVELDPTEPQDITPKIQYTLNVEIKEELWTREQLPLISLTNKTVTPVLEGSGELP